MNLLMYFCIPLVVTGQIVIGGRSYIENISNEEDSVGNLESPQASETETYSKHEYGDHVGYRNHPHLNEFIIGTQGQLLRRPAVEDSGEIGKPSIYNTGGENDNGHPSFIASNIYNSLRDKKNKGRNENSQMSQMQMPSPLAYGAPSPTDPPSSQQIEGAITISANDLNEATKNAMNQQNLSPIMQQVPLVPQHVLLQDPHSGQLIQSPLFQNGLVPLYHPSQLAPHQVAYVSEGGGVTSPQIPLNQKLVPTLKNAYQQELVEKQIDPVHQELLIKNQPAVPLYQTSLLKTGYAPVYSHLVKAPGEPAHHEVPVVKTEEAAQHYHHPQQLLVPIQTPLVKTSGGGLVHEKLASPQSHPTPLLKTGAVPLYYHPLLLKSIPADPTLYQGGGLPLLLKSVDGAIYQAPLLKSPDNTLLLQSPAGAVYQTPVAAPAPAVVQPHTQSPVILKDTGNGHPLYQQQAVLNDHTANALLNSPCPHTFQANILKTGNVYKTLASPVLKKPLLKTPAVEAHIVPAIEENHTELVEPANVRLVSKGQKQLQLTKFLLNDAVRVRQRQNQPNVQVQKAVLQKPAVLTEKAVLKATLAPVFANPEILRAPLVSHYVKKGNREQNLPARILSSQKALIRTLISSDARKNFRGRPTAELLVDASNIELVPSLSYGYSYSLYPRANGKYGPPRNGHHH